MADETNTSGKPRLALWAALIPVVALIVLLVLNVLIYSDDATYGPNQIALLLAAAVAGVVGGLYGIRFPQMMNGIVTSLGSALGAIIILLLIGSLAGTWMISGVVPAMIYYGLDVLNPQIFLVATVIVCAIVSLATGSSWSTVATVGIALLGIGKALGIHEGLAAGAIISGAYFGDKMSPLSDTTNLAAAMAGTNLFTHIRYMMWTTVPSLVLTLVIFLAIGLMGSAESSGTSTAALKSAIAEHFNFSPWLMIVPALVIVMVIFKIDAVVALFAGVLLGALFAVVFQPQMVKHVSAVEGSYAKQAYVGVVNAMSVKTTGVEASEVERLEAELLTRAREVSGNPQLTLEEFDESELKTDDRFADLQGPRAAAALLEGKGMVGMLNTIWLIVTAMCFGGMMEACGLLQRITEPLVRLAKSTGSLIATTAGSCFFVNVTASDQYLAIVVPGRMFRETYQERGLAPENLSRTLEDSGTVTSVLVPWNTCGATQAGVLGVSTLTFAPFCFFNIISPFMTMFFAFAGIKIARLSSKADKNHRTTDSGR